MWELLDSLEDQLKDDPRAAGIPHPDFGGRFWVHQSPDVERLPTVYVLYEIDDAAGIVTLWSFRRR